MGLCNGADKGHLARQMRWTAYDSRTAARAAAAAVLLLVVSWLVTASTDEGGLGWAVRAGRVLPLAPACSALATWLALARARARGEVHALQALGRSPWQCAAPAIGGASGVALLCATAVLLVHAIDVQGFFPAAPRAAEYRYEDHAFVDAAGGVRIEANGDILPGTREPGSAPRSGAAPGVPPGGRIAAALVLAVAGIAFPMASARLDPGARGARRRSASGARTAAALGTTAVTSVLLFHAAAAGRTSPLLSAIPPLVLLAAAAFRYGEDSWQTTRG
jgi:hypothetical protein